MRAATPKPARLFEYNGGLTSNSTVTAMSGPYSNYTFLRSKSHAIRNCELQSILLPEGGDGTFTATKVVATIGPATQDTEVLAGLLDAGLVGARLDLTWGPLEFHRQSLENLQSAIRQTRKLCATMVDSLGRELMIRRQVKMDENGWPVHEDPFTVRAGQQITITTRMDVEASADTLPITYSKFPGMVERGDTVYIGRYLVCGADSASLYLDVLEVTDTDVLCLAKNDAELDGLLTVFHAERSRDELANVQNDLPLLSDYDKECITILSHDFEIDFLSLSYTRDADDVREARRFLNSVGMLNTQILAKVETRQSLLNFQGILNEADGVIISRGNLGLDCLPEKMALVQKTLIQACNLVGKPCVITRVVDTMVNTPRPTRAEATDVANAVLDGVDGILLGAETLRGKYALETVRTIGKICRSAERVFDHHYHYDHLMDIAFDVLEEDMSDGDSLHGSSSHGTPRVGSAADITGRQSIPPPLVGVSAVGMPMNGGSTPASQAAAAGNANGLGAAAQQNEGNVKRPESLPHMSISMAVRTMAKFGMASSSSSLQHMGQKAHGSTNGTGERTVYRSSPYLSKLESIASSAVRTADRVQAALIVVYTHTGKTAQLVGKYRPPMPILTLVVPHLVSDSLKWRLEGRSNARQCLLSRGLLPMLAAPSPSGDALLEEAIEMANLRGLVRPNDYVVVVQRIHDDFCVKIVAVNELGIGIKRNRNLKDPESAYGGGFESPTRFYRAESNFSPTPGAFRNDAW